MQKISGSDKGYEKEWNRLRGESDGKEHLTQAGEGRLSCQGDWERRAEKREQALGNNIPERGNRNTKAMRQELAEVCEEQNRGQCGWSRRSWEGDTAEYFCVVGVEYKACKEVCSRSSKALLKFLLRCVSLSRLLSKWGLGFAEWVGHAIWSLRCISDSKEEMSGAATRHRPSRPFLRCTQVSNSK